jgi:hypothetical protein
VAAGGLVISTAGVAGAASSSGSTCAAPSTLTASEQASTTGITKNSVTVGNISIISGPVPGLFQGAPYGVQAYFNYINSTKGGVYGRKLNVQSLDDAFLGTQNQSETTQSVASDFALVGSFSLFDNFGCNVLAQNPGVSDVSVTLDPGTNSLPNVFSAEPLEQGAPLTPYQYLKTKYPTAVKHVANLVSNTDTAIANWQGQEAAMKHIGYQFSYVREVSPIETNFTTDVINMKNDGTQMVLLTDGDWQIYSALVKEMAQQNFHPILMSAGPAYSSQFIQASGGAQNANGLWLISGQSLYLGQDAKVIPAVKTFDTWIQKTHPGFAPDLYTLFGWASAQLFVNALQAAGPNPTRGKLQAALKQVTNFSASNLLAPANPAKKLAPNCVMFAQIKNGQYTRVPPTAKSGWDCTGVYYSVNGPQPKVNPVPGK